jgi:hypothetical protein
MSFPFGATSVAEYMRWADSKGCNCQCGYGGPNGSPVIKITSPTGKYTHILMNQDEFMPPSELARHDRRLQMRSPFNYPDGCA